MNKMTLEEGGTSSGDGRNRRETEGNKARELGRTCVGKMDVISMAEISTSSPSGKKVLRYLTCGAPHVLVHA